MRAVAPLVAAMLALALFATSTAFGKKGDIIVGDSNNATVYRVNPNTGGKTVVSDDPRLARPNDVVFGRDGTIYVADYGSGGEEPAVFSINPRTGATDVVSEDPRFGTPDGIAMAPSGDLYVTDLDANSATDQPALFRIHLPSGATSAVSTDPLLDGGPIGVVVPPNGAPIVGESQVIAQVDPVSGAATTISDDGDGLLGGEGLARGPDGTLYFIDYSSGAGLEVVDPNTGQVSSPFGPLPQYDGYGLTYDFHHRIVFGDGADLYSINLRNGDVDTIAEDFGYPEGSEVEPPKCKGKTATIVGSTKKDKLKGSKFKDVIATLGGKDKVNAKGGNDIVCGGKGKDKLKGGQGRDKLFGQAGKDKLNGGPGKDVEKQ
jgi:DNA-binding beta-propeller fold protein YncE